MVQCADHVTWWCVRCKTIIKTPTPKAGCITQRTVPALLALKGTEWRAFLDALNLIGGMNFWASCVHPSSRGRCRKNVLKAWASTVAAVASQVGPNKRLNVQRMSAWGVGQRYPRDHFCWADQPPLLDMSIHLSQSLGGWSVTALASESPASRMGSDMALTQMSKSACCSFHCPMAFAYYTHIYTPYYPFDHLRHLRMMLQSKTGLSIAVFHEGIMILISQSCSRWSHPQLAD